MSRQWNNGEDTPVNETSQACMPCKIPRKQKMLKTIKVNAMPVAVRLTPSRGGGVPAWTGERKSWVQLQISLTGNTCMQRFHPPHVIQLIWQHAGDDK